MLTPYAVLLVRPSDGDDTVRAAFHEIARRSHPDSHDQSLSALWYLATMAYAALKTAKARDTWLAKQIKLSGLCGICKGYGIVVERRREVRVCTACEGEGRIRRSAVFTAKKR
jgi:DnaJ-class molecular chaperone